MCVHVCVATLHADADHGGKRCGASWPDTATDSTTDSNDDYDWSGLCHR